MSQHAPPRFAASAVKLAAIGLCLLSTELCSGYEPTPLPIGAAAPDFSLIGVDDKEHSLAAYSSAKVLAIVFTCNHCPTAQAYEERIQALADDYRERGVQVVAICPNDAQAVRLDELGYTDLGDSLAEMKLRAVDRGFTFPYLYDGESQAVAKAYGPATTPQVFLFDGERKLRYRGRIDDNENPAKVESHDARIALDALLANAPIATATTRTFGCSIKWHDKRADAAAALAQWDEEAAELHDIDAAEVKRLRAETKDKVLLINVWSTACGPCVSEFPQLVEMHRMYRKRDFALIAIATDPVEKRDSVLKFLNAQHASCQNFIFSGKNLDELAEALDARWQGALPYTVVVLPGGRIAYRQMGSLAALAAKRAVVEAISPYYFPPLAEDQAKPDADGWYTLFDGKTLHGWRAAETPGSAKVEEGVIVCGGGPRAHLFYVGPAARHDFQDFHLQLEVNTQPQSNSGVYFHTEFQAENWPEKGYEAQINNSQSDWRRTGSLYAVEDVRETPVQDGEWWTYDIEVRGQRITLAVNGKTTVDYVEPPNPPKVEGHPGRQLSHGTIALQCHDPDSVVRYRNIRIKPLEGAAP